MMDEYDTDDANDRLEDDKLQRFFDGDLTEGESEVVGRDIERSERKGARFAQLERLGDLVRFASEEAPVLDSDALFDRVSTTVSEDRSPRLQVMEGARQKRTWGVVAVGLAAAAAVALVFFQNPNDPRVADHPMDDVREVLAEHRQGAHPADNVREVLVEHQPTANVHPPGGSSVEEIDFGANTGTVFEVQGEEGQPLAVVWIAENTP